ncbi:MAG TPA: MaoC family dehydratase [Solirubrobacterales bacterium]|nr:MaoC family dehydratase [Solirubrobacterales bacterium]
MERLMAGVEAQGVEGMRAIVGREIGPSEARMVTQELIDAFADVSGDHQWIHVDPERAKKESPYGTTIAHGNLTLSLADSFRKELLQASGFALGVNYGWNKVRFPAPVPVDSRIVGAAELVSFDELDGGWWQAVTKFTITVEGAEKPSFVGESVTRMMAPPG